MARANGPAVLKCRSVFISDLHLGSRACRADYLLDMLTTIQTDTLYLIGDVVDFLAMRRMMYWPQSHQDVVRTIINKAKNGTRVIYIPGNHDDRLRDAADSDLLNVQIKNRHVHLTRRGRRLLLMHGDEFDTIVQCGAFARFLGVHSYALLIAANRLIHAVRRRLGWGYWSLAAFIKTRVGNAMAHVDRFERAAASAARQLGVDGIVCGHIHHPNVREIDGVIYCNDGDWVENCTLLMEHRDGRLELVRWSERAESVKTVEELDPSLADFPRAVNS